MSSSFSYCPDGKVWSWCYCSCCCCWRCSNISACNMYSHSAPNNTLWLALVNKLSWHIFYPIHATPGWTLSSTRNTYCNRNNTKKEDSSNTIEPYISTLFLATHSPAWCRKLSYAHWESRASVGCPLCFAEWFAPAALSNDVHFPHSLWRLLHSKPDSRRRHPLTQ